MLILHSVKWQCIAETLEHQVGLRLSFAVCLYVSLGRFLNVSGSASVQVWWGKQQVYTEGG